MSVICCILLSGALFCKELDWSTAIPQAKDMEAPRREC